MLIKIMGERFRNKTAYGAGGWAEVLRSIIKPLCDGRLRDGLIIQVYGMIKYGLPQAYTFLYRLEEKIKYLSRIFQDKGGQLKIHVDSGASRGATTPALGQLKEFPLRRESSCLPLAVDLLLFTGLDA